MNTMIYSFNLDPINTCMNHHIYDLRHSQIVYNISDRDREKQILHGRLLTLEMTGKNCFCSLRI
jgi:hypothetical protein